MTTDPIVRRVQQKLGARSRRGLEKYGVGVGHLTTREALQHLQEELLDGANYIEAALDQLPAAPPPAPGSHAWLAQLRAEDSDAAAVAPPPPPLVPDSVQIGALRVTALGYGTPLGSSRGFVFSIAGTDTQGQTVWTVSLGQGERLAEWIRQVVGREASNG